MNFAKPSSDSEGLLLSLVQAENPTQKLSSRYDGLSARQEQELDSMVGELQDLGYINVMWADDSPYFVTLNGSARAYAKELAEYDAKVSAHSTQDVKMKNIIFISHRSSDKDIADMLVDFFAGTGIPKENVFCSSLPGNDINERISDEVKSALKRSAVNIAILSQEYYQSAYCLNEAGILWYEDVPVIPIALPEITPDNMCGFLNSEYKLRRLDSDADIPYIYDTVREATASPYAKDSIVTQEKYKLRERYGRYLETRNAAKEPPVMSQDFTERLTTDDERIVLFYMLQENVRRVSKSTVCSWLLECEIDGVNVDNAFDLLSSFEGGTINDNTLELGIDAFRACSANATQILPILKQSVEEHRKLAADAFKKLWRENGLNSKVQLFVSYIVDEQVLEFGARWMAREQISRIKQWEDRKSLDDTLSSNYENCLDFFIRNDFVYACEWTEYNNPRKFVLHASLKEFLLSDSPELTTLVQEVKDTYRTELPF